MAFYYMPRCKKNVPFQFDGIFSEIYLDMWINDLGLDHRLVHQVGWVERSETQHNEFVGFRASTQPTILNIGRNDDHGHDLDTIFEICKTKSECFWSAKE